MSSGEKCKTKLKIQKEGLQSVETEDELIRYWKRTSAPIKIYVRTAPYRPAWEISCQVTDANSLKHGRCEDCLWIWTAGIRFCLHQWGCTVFPWGLSVVSNSSLESWIQFKKSRSIVLTIKSQAGSHPFTLTHHHVVSHSCYKPERWNGHGLAWPQPSGLPWVPCNTWLLSWHTAVALQKWDICTQENTSAH